MNGWRIPELLSDEQSFGVFLLVTVLLGGGAAFLSGRAIAATWRPQWHLVPYVAALAVAVRFLHYALFESKFLAPYYYVVDYAVCLTFSLVGFRLMRVHQMVTRYRWIHEPVGRLRWRRREAEIAEQGPK